MSVITAAVCGRLHRVLYMVGGAFVPRWIQAFDDNDKTEENGLINAFLRPRLFLRTVHLTVTRRAPGGNTLGRRSRRTQFLTKHGVERPSRAGIVHATETDSSSGRGVRIWRNACRIRPALEGAVLVGGA